MTLELAKADDQIVYVRHHTGSYTTGSVWTTDLTNGGTTITPVSVGTYRLQFATPITLTAGVHAFYIAMAVPASLYFTPAAVPSQDKYITMLQGGESASAYALPTTQVGMPNAVLHLTKVSAWSPHTVRTRCAPPCGWPWNGGYPRVLLERRGSRGGGGGSPGARGSHPPCRNAAYPQETAKNVPH